MKRIIALLLIGILSFSLVACNSKTDDKVPEQKSAQDSAYKKLYDFVNENGAEMTGYNALTAAVEDSYISIIAKSESTIELMLLSETEELATKVSVVLTEGQPEHKVSLVSIIDGESATYEGYINAETYDPDNPEFVSFSSETPESLQAEEKKALAAAVNYTIVIGNKAMESAEVTVSDLGLKNFADK